MPAPDFLYHTTNIWAIRPILQDGCLKPGHLGHVSLSETIVTDDISGDEVAIAFRGDAFGDALIPVIYTAEWFRENRELAFYVVA
jgi:hypothetical protein